MTSEPTYPADVAPGRIAPDAPASGAATPPAGAGTNWQKVGVRAAIGIGSAAVAAALLYTSRNRKG